jgi:glutathione synthase/RimK-type ligase-like ATP-grasp enzyme
MMMKRVKIFSYNPYSEGAKNLANALGIKRIKHNNSKYVPNREHLLINWGSTSLPIKLRVPRVLNLPALVRRVSNKLIFFETFGNEEEVNLPPHTTDQQIATEWSRDGYAIVCRTVLNGHGGAGIVLANTEQDLVDAPLYTQYVKKKDEYRVHVFRGNAIDVQRKARVRGREHVNWQIRNHENGFIYQRHDIDPPDSVIEQALTIMRYTGLDFGAVDVVWNNKEEDAYILEVNTAPGLTGTTLDIYTKVFREYIDSI